MNEIASRIKELIKDMGISQNEFASRIGTDCSNFSKQMNGKLAISRVLTNKIIVELGVSKEWLIEGIGNKFKNLVTDNSKMVTLPSNAIRNDKSEGAKVYDIDVTAGANGRSMMFTSEQVIGSINVPCINPENYIVRVSGDSMKPVINDGDMLAIREVNLSLIFWGQIYVLLLDDYRMVKYIRKHENPDFVILKSANPDYDDIEIPRKDIRSLFVVENVIRFDSRL